MLVGKPEEMQWQRIILQASLLEMTYIIYLMQKQGPVI